MDKEHSDLTCEQAEYEDSLKETINEIIDTIDRTQPKNLSLKRPTIQLPEFEDDIEE